MNSVTGKTSTYETIPNEEPGFSNHGKSKEKSISNLLKSIVVLGVSFAAVRSAVNYFSSEAALENNLLHLSTGDGLDGSEIETFFTS